MTDNELIEFEENGLYGLKDVEGNVVQPACYQEFYVLDDNNLILGIKDDKYVMIGEHGKKIHPCEFDNAWQVGDGFHIAVKDGKQNVFDMNGKFQFADWYDEISALEGGVFLLRDGKEVLYVERVGDIPVKCPKGGMYSHDGKMIYRPDIIDGTLFVKAGVESIAYYEYEICQLNTEVKFIFFDEGVATIGTGWEDYINNNGKELHYVDICLPSSLEKVDANAFVLMTNLIRNIYVPKGTAEAMKSILPAHLHSFVRERKTGSKWLKVPIDMADFLRQPYITLMKSVFFRSSSICKLLQMVSTMLLLVIASFGWSEFTTTILPFSYNFMWYLLVILIIGSIPFIYMQNSKYKQEFPKFKDKVNGFILYAWAWSFDLAAAIGLVLFVIFGSNSYLGGGEQKQAMGTVVDNYLVDETYHVIATMPESSYIAHGRVGKDDSYKVGSKISIHYHEGFWGILIADSISHRE